LISRRGLIGVAAVGALAGAPARKRPAVEFRLGVASISLRKFSRARMIEGVKALGTPYVNLKSVHLPYDLSPGELAAARREIEEAGLEIVGAGNHSIRSKDDLRKLFEYARAAGIPLLVVAPTPDLVPRLEPFVSEYGIAAAIHNHGPEDPHFPTPGSALALVRDLDPRVGLCVDVGHAARAGADVVREIAAAGNRVLDVHMKDLRDLSRADSQCPVGEGAIPVAAILRELRRVGYRGCVNLEYEIDPEDPIPGMKLSFAFLRGVLAGMDS
jgi:sugar phosphate isomerase/epimerase